MFGPKNFLEYELGIECLIEGHVEAMGPEEVKVCDKCKGVEESEEDTE